MVHLKGELFEEFWALYPEREGGNPKAAAKRKWAARINAGVSSQEMLDGARRYAAYCRSADQDPRYVKQARTFLGPDEWWKESWAYTESKAVTDREAEDRQVKEFQDRFAGRQPDIQPRRKPKDGEEGDGPTRVGAILPDLPPPPSEGSAP